MRDQKQFSNRYPILHASLALMLVATVAAVAQGQTYHLIYSFTGGLDGSLPSGLFMDNSGIMYGTASWGGRYEGTCSVHGCGTVFKLQHVGPDWVFTPLYNFTGSRDGAVPFGRVISGPDGALYGTTQDGGGGPCQNRDGIGCGTVFRLGGPDRLCRNSHCFRGESVLYRFQDGIDGAFPVSEVVFDQAGNMYGTAAGGGINACSGGCGVVYKLTSSNGSWAQSVLYSFAGGEDGANPASRLIFDGYGNLYGTTTFGGSANCGTVFQLVPSQSGWAEKIIYSFTCGDDGSYPIIGVILDPAGNLYGGTVNGGRNGGGTLFKLTPSGNVWNFSLLYSFAGYGDGGPGGDLMFRNGKLYGTTNGDGPYTSGNVFVLSPSGNEWTYTSLYDFRSEDDGAAPYCILVFDSDGNMYGTTLNGEFGLGNIFEITP